MSDPAQEDLSGSEGDQTGSSPPSKCEILSLVLAGAHYLVSASWRWSCQLVNVTQDWAISDGVGVRVCGDVVWCYFWCGFAEIYILNCGIVVKILPKFSECSSDSIDCGKKKKKLMDVPCSCLGYLNLRTSILINFHPKNIMESIDLIK